MNLASSLGKGHKVRDAVRPLRQWSLLSRIQNPMFSPISGSNLSTTR